MRKPSRYLWKTLSLLISLMARTVLPWSLTISIWRHSHIRTQHCHNKRGQHHLPSPTCLLLWTPIQAIFIGLAISAIGDGSASIIGKSIGKHKFPKWLDYKKSFEGLFAGSFASLISAIIILLIFPFSNQSNWLVLMIGVGSMMIFAFNDLFNRKIADNITNSLFPALFTWALAVLFGGL